MSTEHSLDTIAIQLRNKELKSLVVKLGEELRLVKLQLQITQEELARHKQLHSPNIDKFLGTKKLPDWIDKIYDSSKRGSRSPYITRE